MKRLGLIAGLLVLAPLGVFGQGILQPRIVTTLPTKCSPSQASGLPAMVWKRAGAQIGLHECLAADTWTYRGFSISGTTATGMAYMSTTNSLVSTGAPTNGQLLVGRTGLVPILATLSGTANETLITNGAGSITIGLAATLSRKVGANFNFQDPTDATKVFQFNAANITTATTRTVTIPDSNTTLPILSQIFTFAGPTAPRTFTFPDANATIARTDAGQTFTGVNVFTSPRLVTSLDDANGNELFKFSATGSAVNEITVANAATGEAPTLSATGDDANINIRLNPKGASGVVRLPAIQFGEQGVLTQTGDTNDLIFFSGGVNRLWMDTNVGNRFTIPSAGGFSFSSTTDARGARDTEIIRSTAKIIGYSDGSGSGGSFSAVATTPAQITSNQNDYNPGGSSYFQRWSSDASRNVTGLTFTAAQVSGQTHMVCNVGAQNIVLTHDDGSTSTAANRFKLKGGTNRTIAADECVMVVYDATTARWRVAH